MPFPELLAKLHTTHHYPLSVRATWFWALLADLTAITLVLWALSGLAMLLSVMIAAAALVVAWVLLVACALFLFAQSSLGWPIPALLIAGGHAALAYYLWQATVRLSWNLTWPELRATLVTKAGVANDGRPLVASRS